MTGSTNMVSGGRNPGYELTCGFPQCGHLIRPKDGRRDGGWCGHADNRVPPEQGWPNGFTPSVASTGGCDLHTSNSVIDMTSSMGTKPTTSDKEPTE